MADKLPTLDELNAQLQQPEQKLPTLDELNAQLPAGPTAREKAIADFEKKYELRVPESVPIIGGWKPSLYEMGKGVVQAGWHALNLPREVYRGEVDPESREGLARILEMAATVTPGAPRVGLPAKVPVRPPEPPLGVTLSRSQETGDLTAAQLEQAALRGHMGEEAQLRAKQFADQQAEQVNAARQKVAEQLGEGEVVSTSPQQTGAIISKGMQEAAKAKKAAVDVAYETAENLGGQLHADTLKDAPARIKSELAAGENPVIIDDKLTPHASNMLSDLQTEINKTLAVPGVVGIDLKRISQIRKRLSKFRSDAFGSGNATDGAAATNVIRAFDNEIDSAVANGMFRGDPAALKAWKVARAEHSDYRATFGKSGAGDTVGAKVEQIIGKRGKDPATANDVADFIFSAAGTNPSSMNRDVALRIRKIFGEASDQWKAVRQGLFDRLVYAGEGATRYGPERITQRLNQFLNKDGKELAEVVFTEDQRKLLQEYANLQRKLVPVEGSVNRSNNFMIAKAIDAVGNRVGAAVAGAIGTVAGHFLGLPPMVGEVVGGAAGTLAAKPIQKLGSRARVKAVADSMPLVGQRMQEWQKAVAAAEKAGAGPGQVSGAQRNVERATQSLLQTLAPYGITREDFHFAPAVGANADTGVPQVPPPIVPPRHPTRLTVNPAVGGYARGGGVSGRVEAPEAAGKEAGRSGTQARGDAAGAEGAGAHAAGEVVEEQGKKLKADVDYSKGMPSAHCGICRFFYNHKCQKVAGKIDATYWCKLFKRHAPPRRAVGGLVPHYQDGGLTVPDDPTRAFARDYVREAPGPMLMLGPSEHTLRGAGYGIGLEGRPAPGLTVRGEVTHNPYGLPVFGGRARYSIPFQEGGDVEDFGPYLTALEEGHPVDPFEASAARVRRRYPVREPDPASLAASQGAVSFSDLAKAQAQGLGALPGVAFEEAGKYARGEPFSPIPGLAAGMLTLGGTSLANPGVGGTVLGAGPIRVRPRPLMSEAVPTAGGIVTRSHNMPPEMEPLPIERTPAEVVPVRPAPTEGPTAPPMWMHNIPPPPPRPIGSVPAEVDLSSSPILHPDTPAIPPRSRNVWDIAKELHDRGQNALKALGVESGVLTADTRTPETDEMLARVMAHETLEAMNREGHAGDWYTTSVRDAMKTAALLYPEIATDPHAKFGLLAAKAITSQGETVPSNVRLADQVYQHFKETGRFPTNVEADKKIMINSNFQKLNDLLDAIGPEETQKFLDKQFTVRELEEKGYKVSGAAKDDTVYGSAILGPKIGQGFYQNLNGNFNPVTTDLWFMRTWGRLTGTLSGKPNAVPKSRARLEKELENAGQPVPKNLVALGKVADRIVAEHERDYSKNQALYKSGEKKKSQLTLASERLQQNLHGIKETPSSAAQRRWMASVVGRARQLLAGQGVDLTPADLQAIIWYPEKDIYGKLGGRPSDQVNVNYLQAWRDLARQRGISDEALERAIRPVE